MKSNQIMLISMASMLLLTTTVMANGVSSVRETREPEAATGYVAKQAVQGKKFMVASANPYASKAGFAILQQGGSAVDAAIAVQLVLSLVEPQSSGLGGGTFMLHWDKSKQHLTSFDGRETAPSMATSELFIDKQGVPLNWMDAVVGGRSVGVPGLIATLKAAHDKYGNLPWASLFSHAIELAEKGFVVSPRLEKLLAMNFNPGIHKLAEINQYFFPQGEALKAGDLLINKKLAKVLRSIANEGTSVFYQGWIAQKIVNKVNHAAIAPGSLSMADMAAYQVKERAAVCGPYKTFKICGMAPPSSGGITVIQILAQLQQFNLAKYPVNDGQAIHLISQSSRLAFADRNRYIADADFVSVPLAGLIAADYMAERAKLIDADQDMGKALAGEPKGALAQADDSAIERPSTSHIVVVDGKGNAVSMTSSIENGFGSALMVEGFILNNQLTDFSLAPKEDGKLVANRVQANKRPRSSMAPTMVFNEDGSLKLLVGSPGGSRIINYVAQTLVGMLDWQLNPQQAVSLPHMTNRNNVTTLERGTPIALLKPMLEGKGHKVQVRDLNSGIQAIEITPQGLIGGADPRREGLVLAQ